jgi:phosphate transport system permease protein
MAREIDARAVRRRNRIGRVMTSLTGGALAVSIVMIASLFVLITSRGLAHFWPDDLVEFTLRDGSRVLGEIHQREAVEDEEHGQLRLKVGNRDFTGLDFRWIDEADVVERRRPEDAVVLERL